MGRRQSKGCGYIRRTGRARDGVEGGGRPGLIANSVSRKIGNRQVGVRGCVEEAKGPILGQRLWELGMRIAEIAEESEVGDIEEMGFLRWVVWSEGRRSTMSGYHEMVRVCVQLRAASGGRVDWSSAEMAESGRLKGGGEVRPWYLPDCGADWSF